MATRHPAIMLSIDRWLDKEMEDWKAFVISVIVNVFLWIWRGSPTNCLILETEHPVGFLLKASISSNFNGETSHTLDWDARNDEITGFYDWTERLMSFHNHFSIDFSQHSLWWCWWRRRVWYEFSSKKILRRKLKSHRKFIAPFFLRTNQSDAIQTAVFRPVNKMNHKSNNHKWMTARKKKRVRIREVIRHSSSLVVH